MEEKSNVWIKLQKSTTFAIVLFSMGVFIYHMVLQYHLGKEITYMGEMLKYVFYVLLSYTGKEAGVKMITNWNANKRGNIDG